MDYLAKAKPDNAYADFQQSAQLFKTQGNNAGYQQVTEVLQEMDEVRKMFR